MKVLVVDDEELIRRSLKRAFEMKNHQVVVAADGANGLKAWLESDPDVVILDVLMPGLTGPQVLQAMTSPFRARVILISAYTGEYNLEKAKNLGADIFIAKPFHNVFEIVEIAERYSHKASTTN